MAEMSNLEQAYKDEKVADFGNVSVHLFKASTHSYVILYTKGMSAINQHELAGKSEQIHAFVELYFLLPSYWDINKANQKWPLDVFKRLINAQVDKSTWFGPGDTLTAHSKVKAGKNDQDTIEASINTLFKQNHFILTEPITAESMLSNISLKKEPVNWLAIVPIYQKEFDYKNSRSALELMLAFEKKQISELIDEHRPIAIKKRFFGLFY